MDLISGEPCCLATPLPRCSSSFLTSEFPQNPRDREGKLQLLLYSSLGNALCYSSHPSWLWPGWSCPCGDAAPSPTERRRQSLSCSAALKPSALVGGGNWSCPFLAGAGCPRPASTFPIAFLAAVGAELPLVLLFPHHPLPFQHLKGRGNTVLGCDRSGFAVVCASLPGFVCPWVVGAQTP